MWRHQLGRLLPSASRSLASFKGRADVRRVPLNEPYPGFEKHTDASVGSPSSSSDPFEAELSKLDTGLRVVSQPHHGDFVTIGVAVDSGCRYEAAYTKGTSRFIEKLGFGSTTRLTTQEMFRRLDSSSAIIDCQSTRDTTIFAASCHRSGTAEILELIADAALRPLLLEEEVAACRSTVENEMADMRIRIDAIEPLVTDMLHQAAYKNNTLGFSKFTTPESAKVTRADVVRFQRAHHLPGRMVVAGVGVEHSELVSLSTRYFVPNTSEPPAGMTPTDKSIAQYTGGEHREVADLSKVGAGTPYPLLAHVGLAFESASYLDQDFVAFCLLQSLMGGGNSFSAGGPGKGMYTRLYLDVLNHHHWMYGCQAFNHSYADTGIFAVIAGAPPEGIGAALGIILEQFLRLGAQLPEQEELERAKTQLKSQLLMNLEMRPVMFEDLARQVMGHGYRKKPEEYMARIDAVRPEDIQRVGRRMLAGRPTLVGYGDLTELPAYEKLDEAVARWDLGMLAPTGKKKNNKLFSWM